MTKGILIKKTGTTVEAGQRVGQDKSLDISNPGPLEALIRTDQDIEVVPGPAIADGYAAELAFMEEKVEVNVHESTDKNAEPIVDLYCNGIPQRIIRGQPITIKRKYVEILARARQTSINTVVSPSGGPNGDPINRIDKYTAVRYPFSVLRDDNPNGADWLRKTLQSA